MSRSFFHMSSCRNFTTSGLIFKAFIHFKIIYVSGVKQRSHFFSFFSLWLILPQSFPGGSVVKNTPANTRDARDTGSSPGSGRSLGGGNGNLLQYSCLGNPMDRGALWATVHGVSENQTCLSTHTHIHNFPSILFIEEIVLSPLITLATLSNVSWPYMQEFISGFLILSYWSICQFNANTIPHCPQYLCPKYFWWK